MQKEAPPISAPPRQQNIARAVFWMVAVLLSFTLVAIAGREGARGIATIELMFWRAAIGTGVILVVLFALGGRLADLKSQRMAVHGLRGVIHFGAQYSWLYALTLIPLLELFALEFTAPLWVAVLAPAILGERLTPTRVLAALAGFAGALIVVRPAGAGLSEGTLFALASAVGFALSMIATKTLTRTDDSLKIVFWMNALQLLIGVAANHKGLSNPDAKTWVWVVVISLAGLAAHFSLVQAFKYADAIIVAPMDFLRVPLIAVVGVWLYNEGLEAHVLLGTLCVLAANAINIWGERRR